MRKRWKVVIGVASSLLVLVGAMAVVGSLRTTHVITVSRTTTASSEAIWHCGRSSRPGPGGTRAWIT